MVSAVRGGGNGGTAGIVQTGRRAIEGVRSRQELGTNLVKSILDAPRIKVKAGERLDLRA